MKGGRHAPGLCTAVGEMVPKVNKSRGIRPMPPAWPISDAGDRLRIVLRNGSPDFIKEFQQHRDRRHRLSGDLADGHVRKGHVSPTGTGNKGEFQ
jgi:hypothetical protein